MKHHDPPPWYVSLGGKLCEMDHTGLRAEAHEALADRCPERVDDDVMMAQYTLSTQGRRSKRRHPDLSDLLPSMKHCTTCCFEMLTAANVHGPSCGLVHG
jgi:hypothetical protein